MRSILFVPAILLSLGLLSAAPAFAEEDLVAKVYRDYPGYVNPAVCENPNLDKAAPPATPSASPNQPAEIPAAAPATAVSPAPSKPCCDSPLHQSCPNYSIGPYLAVWGGWVATDDLELSSSVDMSVDDGYGVGVAFGYDFGRYRVELESSFRKGDGDKLKTNTGNFNAPEDLEVFTAIVNGYVDFATDGPLTPYLGIGGGYGRAELGDGANDDFIAGQLAAGVMCAITPRVAIDIGYKYLFPVTEEDVELQQHAALLGVQIRF